MLQKFIQSRIDEARSLIVNESSLEFQKLERLARQIHYIFETGKKIAFVGNGGSAAEAMHMAAEFTGKCVIEHKPLPALCLNESQSALTAVANDFGVDFMFSRQVQAHLRRGDLLIAMSTSGKSKNILNALHVAKEMGVETILWMGDFDNEIDGVEIWKAPSTSTPRIQEIHLVWGHIVAEAVERLMQSTEHKPLPALCLNESQSALTAVANDFGVDFMFSRQVQAHLRRGDLLIAMSTSGKSKNILNALHVAKEMGVETILWMGDFDNEIDGVEIWKAPSTSTPRIQEIHLVWGHIVAEAVERLMQSTELSN